MISKKAISPVVATALLLVVAVVAVVGFQTWFGGFQSGIQTEVETKSSQISPLVIEGIKSGTMNAVFYRNTDINLIDVTSVRVRDTSGNVVCSNSSPTDASGQNVNFTEFVTCPLVSGNSYEVVITSPNGVYSEFEIFR